MFFISRRILAGRRYIFKVLKLTFYPQVLLKNLFLITLSLHFKKIAPVIITDVLLFLFFCLPEFVSL